jgi:hypothetical protein
MKKNYSSITNIQSGAAYLSAPPSAFGVLLVPRAISPYPLARSLFCSVYSSNGMNEKCHTNRQQSDEKNSQARGEEQRRRRTLSLVQSGYGQTNCPIVSLASSTVKRSCCWAFFQLPRFVDSSVIRRDQIVVASRIGVRLLRSRFG